MKYTIFGVLSVTCAILYYIYVPNSIRELCELHTCPICYGNDFCKEIEENKIVLQYNSITDYIFNILSVKNVFFAEFEGKKVVLKKLAHTSELKELGHFSGDFNEIKNKLVSDSSEHFKICNIDTAELFLQKLIPRDPQNIQTILYVNAEPILLEMFTSTANWHVPKFYGFCGRLSVMENCGSPLNSLDNCKWFDRAYVALQLLQAANNFTENHKDFRLYLTDISPDNIAVNENFKISFIDLEDAILIKKASNGKIHYTEHFYDESYSYSEKAICDSSISDHNLYAVCRLLLSKNALWPMMKNGLLHTPPKTILDEYSKLFENIELCVDPKNGIDRFKLSRELIQCLETILKKENYSKHV